MVQAQTRDQIVAAADELFYRQGFAQTSFVDISAAVGISRGNFYYHFKTKDEILAEVIRLRLARTAQMLADWQGTGDSPRARIASFIDLMIMNRAKITDTVAQSARSVPNSASWITPRRGRPTGCSPCFATGCSASSPRPVAPPKHPRWRCICWPAVRVLPRWRRAFTTRGFCAPKWPTCTAGSTIRFP